MNFPSNRSDSPAGLGRSLAETMEFVVGVGGPSSRGGDSSVVASQDRQLVYESQSSQLSEMQRQLRIRLRAAALVLLLGFVLFLVRNYLVEPLQRINYPQILVTAVLAGGVFVLSRYQQLPLRTLRTIELMVFFVPAAFFAYLCVVGIDLAAADQDPVFAMAVVKTTVIDFFALIMVYGMFVPSTWKRALWVTALLAISMPCTMIALRLTRPDIQRFLSEIASVGEVSNNALILFLGACGSVIAAHTFYQLRTQALEAKELGQYRLKKLIGQGGMGEVYLAEHHFLRRPCAVKILRADRGIDSDTLGRFEREVRLTSRLTHPNTVQVFDYGRDESGMFFYVMEYLPGLSLQELVDRHGPLEPARVAYLLAQICDALAEAEQEGMVHRDIKPSNILVTQRGGHYDVAKLVDFGLAKPISGGGDVHLSRVGQIAGSPLYLSPEQALGTRPDSRSDLYSLGAVAFFALTGRAPFEGRSAMEVLVSHARDQAPNVMRFNPRTPPQLAEIIQRCLQKEPEKRFGSAREMHEALLAVPFDPPWSASLARQWWTERHESFELERVVNLDVDGQNPIDETIEMTR